MGGELSFRRKEANITPTHDSWGAEYEHIAPHGDPRPRTSGAYLPGIRM